MSKISDINKSDRPRERLLKLGSSSLTTAELLAILIRTGVKGKSAIEIAQDMLNRFGGIRPLFNASYAELSKVKGLSTAKITTLLASMELGLRYAKEGGEKKKIIKSPKDVYEFYCHNFVGLTKEIFIALYLNSRNEVLFEERLGSSTTNMCICHPQEFVRGLLNNGASRLILIHNHPSQDKTPSNNDISFTKDLASHLKYFGFELLDHIIVVENSYTSLKDLEII